MPAPSRSNRRVAVVIEASNAYARGLLAGIPYVETDDAMIATVAADHFFERDFRHFAFLGDDRFRWSDNRCRSFVQVVTAKGHDVDVFSHRRR
jgi:LacI family transcriptional regulator